MPITSEFEPRSPTEQHGSSVGARGSGEAAGEARRVGGPRGPRRLRPRALRRRAAPGRRAGRRARRQRAQEPRPRDGRVLVQGLGDVDLRGLHGLRVREGIPARLRGRLQGRLVDLRRFRDLRAARDHRGPRRGPRGRVHRHGGRRGARLLGPDLLGQQRLLGGVPDRHGPAGQAQAAVAGLRQVHARQRLHRERRQGREAAHVPAPGAQDVQFVARAAGPQRRRHVGPPRVVGLEGGHVDEPLRGRVGRFSRHPVGLRGRGDLAGRRHDEGRGDRGVVEREPRALRGGEGPGPEPLPGHGKGHAVLHLVAPDEQHHQDERQRHRRVHARRRVRRLQDRRVRRHGLQGGRRRLERPAQRGVLRRGRVLHVRQPGGDLRDLRREPHALRQARGLQGDEARLRVLLLLPGRVHAPLRRQRPADDGQSARHLLGGQDQGPRPVQRPRDRGRAEHVRDRLGDEGLRRQVLGQALLLEPGRRLVRVLHRARLRGAHRRERAV